MADFVSIDPGFGGGFAFFNSKGKLLGCVPMPTEKIENTNSRTKTKIDIERAFITLGAFDCSFAILELVSARPHQGIAGMFAFGRGYGVIEGLLTALDVPTYYVHPVVWKRHHDLLKKEKKAAVEIVKRKYGNVHSGTADAILIGEWMLSKLEKLRC